MTTRTMRLANGRAVDVFLGGDPAGTPLVMHHGTPSDATTFAGWHAVCAERRVRLICMSRPGYAGSARTPGRSVADGARDTADLLDRLGHGTFVTGGWSGGGPHALACAALLPRRCTAAAVLAGVGPYGVGDLDFLAGMGPENVAEFGAALAGEATLRAWKHRHAEAFRHVTGDALAEAFGGLIPPVDAQLLVGGFADAMAGTIRRALAGGFDGWIDDDLAFTRPWGFAVGAIGVPVTVWQGDLDLMVPPAHAAWLARRIPASRLRTVPGHGHISLVVTHRHAILDDLLGAEED